VAAGIVRAAGAAGIAPTPPSVLALALVFFVLYGVGIAAVQNLMFALQADTVEYGEWAIGVRTEGSNYAILSVSRCVGPTVRVPVTGFRAGGRSGRPATRPAR
jgi:glucuronide carrier protein